jgi:transketolase
MEPIAAKWEAFGWQALDLDGHDFPTLLAAFDAARAEQSRPTIIIARTTPGKGVPSVEGRYSHFVEFAQSDAEAALAHLEGEAA